jgi:hypothetical protein
VITESSELQARLRVFHERGRLAVLEQTLAPFATGRTLMADEVPRWVREAIERFMRIDNEPVAVVSDQTEPDSLAEWTEGQLAAHGVGPACWVATHLSIKPWISCVQGPGWTRLLRAALSSPIMVLAEDLGAFVSFDELEYHHSVNVATA